MYKFNKIDKDTTELEYNNEKYEIKRNLELAVQMQQVDFEARVLLNKKLKEQGASIEDLQYKRKEGNKTIIDDSQIQLLLDECKKEATYNKLKKIIKDITNIDLLDLAVELGQDDFQKFIQEFVIALTGEPTKTPSK